MAFFMQVPLLCICKQNFAMENFVETLFVIIFCLCIILEIQVANSFWNILFTWKIRSTKGGLSRILWQQYYNRITKTRDDGEGLLKMIKNCVTSSVDDTLSTFSYILK